MTKGDGLPCEKCGTSEWHKNRTCKQCARNRSNQWYWDNTEQSKDNLQKWRQANPDKVREHDRKWRRSNPEKEVERMRIWRRANPEKANAQTHNRRTAQTEAGGSYTASEWKALCKQYGGRCLACGKKTKLTVDHVIPVIAGGSSDISNLQPLCGPCNSSKGDKTTDYRTKPGIKRWIQEKLL